MKRRALQHSRATALTTASLLDEATPDLRRPCRRTLRCGQRARQSRHPPASARALCIERLGIVPAGTRGASTRWDGAARLEGRRAGSLSRNGRMTHNAQLGRLRPREFPDRSLTLRVRLETESRIGSLNPCDHFSLRAVEVGTHLPPFMPCRRTSAFGAGSGACDASSLQVAPPNGGVRSVRHANRPESQPASEPQ